MIGVKIVCSTHVFEYDLDRRRVAAFFMPYLHAPVITMFAPRVSETRVSETIQTRNASSTSTW
jgi:hypothetical protein